MIKAPWSHICNTLKIYFIQPPSEVRWFTFWDRQSARTIQGASIPGFSLKKLLNFEQNFTKFSGGGVLPKMQGRLALFLDFATRGQTCLAQKAEISAFWPFLSNFKAVKTPNRW